MARLFKTTFTMEGSDGQRVSRKAPKWYGEYRDLCGKRRRVALSSDKQASRRALDALMDALTDASAHVSVDADRLPPMVRKAFFKALKRAGHRGAAAESAGKLLVEHVADWHKALLDKGATPSYADLSRNRVLAILDGTGAVYWHDLDAARVASFLADRRNKGLSIESSNHHVRRIRQFCKWMVANQRAQTWPMASLSMMNAKVDRRHDRRALDADELRLLLASASTGPTVRWMVKTQQHELTGPDRATAYRVAVESGLRLSELANLTPGSFDLAADQPTIMVKAAYSKHRRPDMQPIRADLAEALKPWLKDRPTGQPVFDLPEKMSRTIRADLRRAKARWIRETPNHKERRERRDSDFLNYVDADGRYADFHSLRHSYVTALVKGNVAPRAAQALARHSTIVLTMDRYSHLAMGDAAKGLDVLPNLGTPEPKQETAKAEGTYGPNHLAHHLAQNSANRGSPRRTLESSSRTHNADADEKAADVSPDASGPYDADLHLVAPGYTGQEGMRVQGLEPWTHGLKGRCSTN
jgi:site-specific recombinase XerC